MKATIDGTTYEMTPEREKQSCYGCVAQGSNSLCAALRKSEKCLDLNEGVIWIKETKEELKEESSEIERTYTENQVRSVIDMIREIDGIDISSKFWDYLIIASDVEYNEYIRLKNKFNPK